MYASAADVLSRINPAVGVVEAIDEHTVSSSPEPTVETVAVYIGMLGLDFTVTEPLARCPSGDAGQRYASAISANRESRITGTDSVCKLEHIHRIGSFMHRHPKSPASLAAARISRWSPADGRRVRT